MLAQTQGAPWGKSKALEIFVKDSSKMATRTLPCSCKTVVLVSRDHSHIVLGYLGINVWHAVCLVSPWRRVTGRQSYAVLIDSGDRLRPDTISASGWDAMVPAFDRATLAGLQIYATLPTTRIRPPCLG